MNNCLLLSYKYSLAYVYIGDSDILVARDRLKGALRELLQHSDTGSSADSGEESSAQDYKHSMKKM